MLGVPADQEIYCVEPALCQVLPTEEDYEIISAISSSPFTTTIQGREIRSISKNMGAR
jgi:hypothetical protein